MLHCRLELAQRTTTGMRPSKANKRTPTETSGEGGYVARNSKQPSRHRRRLTPKEVEDFQQRLLDKRRDLIGDVRCLHDEAMNSGGGGGNGSNSMPIHMAERGSDTWEQAFTLRLSEAQASILRDIDAALQRIQDGAYGICEATGERIAKARLRAIPWTRYSIEYARKCEGGLA